MAAHLPDEATRPTEIRRLGPAGLRITWFDGHVSIYPLKYLRLGCECAVCVDEWTHERLIRPENVPAELTIEAIAPVGWYAVQLSWSDGHDTGIYSYDYLRQICPCPGCRAREE